MSGFLKGLERMDQAREVLKKLLGERFRKRLKRDAIKLIAPELSMLVETKNRPDWKRSAITPSAEGCAHHNRTVERREPRTIYRCRDCRIAFPAEEEGALDETQSEFWTDEMFEKMYWKDRNWTYSHWAALICRACFMHGVDFYLYDPPNKRALEVGFGAGYFLHMLRGYLQYEVWGLEPSEWGRRHAREEFGLVKNMYNATTAEEAGLEDDFFGLVTLVHALEHVKDPLALLKDIHRVAAPGALFYGEVPDSDYYHDWHIQAHLWFFNEESLDFYLRSAGFEVIRIFAGRHMSWPEPLEFLSWLARKKE